MKGIYAVVCDTLSHFFFFPLSMGVMAPEMRGREGGRERVRDGEQEKRVKRAKGE